MDIGLCLIVKDEENRIEECLNPLIDVFEHIVIVDTGSTDRTLEILRDKFRLTPIVSSLDEANCFSKCGARNLAYSSIPTPWILSLDADERIERGAAQALRRLEAQPDVAGYFFEWNTYRGDTTTVDYKLSLFTKGCRSSGFAHENMQVDMRRRGLRAVWYDQASISHFPEINKDAWKSEFYTQRLLCSIDRDPDWIRYHWFLGYTLYRQGAHQEAARYLSIAADSHSKRFPVECINAKTVMATLQAELGDNESVLATIVSGAEFLQQVADDFEILVNFRLKAWFADMEAAARAGDYARIRPYEFAY